MLKYALKYSHFLHLLLVHHLMEFISFHFFVCFSSLPQFKTLSSSLFPVPVAHIHFVSIHILHNSYITWCEYSYFHCSKQHDQLHSATNSSTHTQLRFTLFLFLFFIVMPEPRCNCVANKIKNRTRLSFIHVHVLNRFKL